MRYLCVHCDKRFDHEGEKKPRCPECMRKHGIEPIADVGAGADKPKWMMPAIAVGVIALVGGGYAYWANQTPDVVSDEVSMRPLDATALSGHIRRVNADVTDDQEALLVASEGIEEFAESAAGSESGAFAKATAIVEAIKARKTAGAFRTWSMSTPRDTPVDNAADAFLVLEEDGGRARLYPLEVAAVAVAALRSLDVDAMLTEIYAFPDDRAPPDPSGHLGYFGVAVYADDTEDSEVRVFDPYGGRNNPPEEDETRMLSDLQAVGAMVNHLAEHRLVRDGDHDQAAESAEAALKLDRQSPSIRSVLGAVLLTTGARDRGISEFESAAQLRADAPRRNNMAGLYMMQQDMDAALREVTAALELTEDFGGARVNLAAIHMSNGELPEARIQLERAEELDRDLPNLSMMWANYYLTSNEPDRAVEYAMTAIDQRPHEWQTRLQAARVFRAANRFDEMREQARTIMGMVPETIRAQVEQTIIQVLGDTALEEPIDDELLDEELGELPSGEFQLEGGGLLGGGEEPGLGGGLLDEELGEGLGDPELRLGDPSSFTLGGGGGDLRLNLD